MSLSSCSTLSVRRGLSEVSLGPWSMQAYILLLISLFKCSLSTVLTGFPDFMFKNSAMDLTDKAIGKAY